jgi:hypothetical protein
MIISWTENSKEVIVDDSSYRLRQIMGENNVTLNFSLPEYIEFPLGATIDFEGQTYTLNTPQSLNEVNSKYFEYKLIFGSNQELLNNFKLKDVEGRLKFPFTAKPHEHLQLIVNVLNTNDSGWSVGEYLEGAEKLISYNHTNCFAALQTIASEFETEYEINGKTINLRKVSYNELTPLALSYGKGNGFVSGVGRNNDSGKSGFTTLYVQGGERNIDFSKYGSKDLLLPKNKSYTYLGKTYITDAYGLSIQRSGFVIHNIKEESLDCTHIYPQRIGTISEVIVVDEEKNFYDFIDASIPADLDFSALRMNGEKITIRFESGRLAGREFDIEQSDTIVSGYIHDERRFKLVPKEEDGYTMPNDVFIPMVGDKYAVFGMMMPTAYICNDDTQTGASWEMFKKAIQHFYENEESKFTFKGELDGIWAKKDWVNIGGKIVVGGFISFSDVEFQPTGINIRITSIKDYINNPYSPIIELANSVQGVSITSELDKIKENEVVTEVLHSKSLDFTRRTFRDAKETIKLLEAAKLNFSTSINPISVNAMQLLVGDKSLQFRFVDGGLNKISHSATYDKTTKQFTAVAGKLQHLTIGIDAIKPNPVYKTWDIPLYTSAVLSDAKKSYYLYVKASKTLTTGVFLLSETSIALEEVTGFYHFLTGILNTEFEKDRSFVKMYGFTEILPGQIKVDKLTSGNGLQVIELLDDQIKINAKVTFANDSPALLAQEQAILNAKTEAQNASKAYADAQDSLQAITLNAYSDGIVTDAEANAIAVAKAWADAQDLVYQTTLEAYADGVVSAEEARAIADATDKANIAEANAKAYALERANLAQAAADSALSTASTANTNATTANNLLADIANDNKLTPSEKQDTKREWDSIVSEKTINDTQADLFAVSKTAYGTAYTNLSNYITPLLVSLTTTSDITGTTFRDTFKAYYDARLNLLNAIAAKAKTLADTAQSAATTANNTAITANNTANTALSVANNAKNDLAIKLGYASFADMEAKAQLGQTVISGGYINTVLIDAVAVVAKYMQTELLVANSVVSNNGANKVNINAISGRPLEVFNSAGQVQLELVEVNGSVQYIYRNKAGQIIWYLGESGMTYAQFTAEAYNLQKFKFIGEMPYDEWTFGISSTPPPNSRVTQAVNGNDYYEYVSETNAGTMVNPTKHGNVYQTQDHNGALIPDGKYYRTDSIYVPQAMIDSQTGLPYTSAGDVIYYGTMGASWWEIRVHQFTSGKITSSFSWFFRYDSGYQQQ